MDLKRTIRCSNCGNESNVQISSDLEMKELLLAGKCTRCGSAMQINYTLVDGTSQSSNPTAQSSQSNENSLPDLDENLFGSSKSEVDNDMLRDLMDD
jgi:transcription elongation factor Elf1